MNEQQHINGENAVLRMQNVLADRLGPALQQIALTGFETATQADYINGIDAVMIDCAGMPTSLQFKSRQTGDDVCIELATVPKQTAVSHYNERHRRHFIVDTRAAQRFVQELKDGTTLIYDSMQLHVLAQYPDFWAFPIHKNPEGQFLLFIPKDRFRFLLQCVNDLITDG